MNSSVRFHIARIGHIGAQPLTSDLKINKCKRLIERENDGKEKPKYMCAIKRQLIILPSITAITEQEVVLMVTATTHFTVCLF